jgi:hypothetical protein
MLDRIIALFQALDEHIYVGERMWNDERGGQQLVRVLSDRWTPGKAILHRRLWEFIEDHYGDVYEEDWVDDDSYNGYGPDEDYHS